MKKLIAILLAVALLASMATVVSAANIGEYNDYYVSIGTTVPYATYTLYIPTSLEIPFGVKEYEFPRPEVVASSGFYYRKLYIAIPECDIAYFGEETGHVVDMDIVGNSSVTGESHTLLKSKIVDDSGSAVPPYVDHYLVFGHVNEDGSLKNECYMERYTDEIGDSEEIPVDSLSLVFDKMDWRYMEPGEYSGSFMFMCLVYPAY